MNIAKIAKGHKVGLGKVEVEVEGAIFYLDTLGRVKVRKNTVPKGAPYQEYMVGGEFWKKAVRLLKGK